MTRPGRIPKPQAGDADRRPFATAAGTVAILSGMARARVRDISARTALGCEPTTGRALGPVSVAVLTRAPLPRPRQQPGAANGDRRGGKPSLSDEALAAVRETGEVEHRSAAAAISAAERDRISRERDPDGINADPAVTEAMAAVADVAARLAGADAARRALPAADPRKAALVDECAALGLDRRQRLDDLASARHAARQAAQHDRGQPAGDPAAAETAELGFLERRRADQMRDLTDRWNRGERRGINRIPRLPG